MRGLRGIAAVIVAASLIALAGCGGTPAAPASGSGSGKAPLEVAVSLKGMKIVPSDITVAVGGTVAFTNDDAVDHIIAGDGFTTATIAPGATFFQVVKAAGSFPIRCTIHPSMTGNLTVR